MSVTAEVAEGEHDGGGLRVAWRTNPGRVRQGNEDAVFTLALHVQQGDAQQAFGIFALADGMGGHENGEQASALAVRTVADELVRRMVAPMLTGGAPPPLGETMRGAVNKAHQRVKKDLPGAGSTLTVAMVIGDSLGIAHVGDSRAYLATEGGVSQLTRDHSVMARLIEEGQETEASDANDPRRSVLYRALGQGGSSLDVDFTFHSFPTGSRLLLCCDGLWGPVEKSTLEGALSTARDLDRACDDLIARANDAGGPDNITVVIAARGGSLPRPGDGA